MTLATFFLLAALACFLLSAFGVEFGRISLVPMGLASLVAASLVGGAIVLG